MTAEAAELVLGIDCSTTACKVLAVDRQGRTVAEGRAAIALENPAPDAWQQDAESWWQSLLEALCQVSEALGPRAAAIVAASIAHQRETFVLTDDAGAPLCPALVWMDARSGPQVAEAIAELGAEQLHRISGKPACTTPSLYKAMFLLQERPELAAGRPRLLDVHGFLVARLCGRFATSLASADPTGLVDMQARGWSSELMALCELEPEQLPELVAPGREIGRLLPEVARSCGLPPELPIIAGAGDGQAAGLGAGVLAPGRAYLNLGTAVVSGVLAREYRTDRAFRTLYGAVDGTFFLESDLQGGTFTVSWLVHRWLRSRHPEPRPSFAEVLAELEREAAELAPGAEGLVLVPYWNGVMDPYWDHDARGVVVGWSGAHGPAHLYRAILEGIAFEQRLHTEGLERAAGPIAELVALGGGSQSELWCQILADVLEKPIVRASSAEATALGAAMLAAVGVGLYPGLDEAAAAMTSTGARYVPGADQPRYQALYDEVYRHLYPALAEPLGRLATLRKNGDRPPME